METILSMVVQKMILSLGILVMIPLRVKRGMTHSGVVVTRIRFMGKKVAIGLMVKMVKIGSLVGMTAIQFLEIQVLILSMVVMGMIYFMVGVLLKRFGVNLAMIRFMETMLTIPCLDLRGMMSITVELGTTISKILGRAMCLIMVVMTSYLEVLAMI